MQMPLIQPEFSCEIDYGYYKDVKLVAAWKQILQTKSSFVAECFEEKIITVISKAINTAAQNSMFI